MSSSQMSSNLQTWWGGKRPKSGRLKKGHIRMTLWVKPGVKAKIVELSFMRNSSYGDVVEGLILKTSLSP